MKATVNYLLSIAMLSFTLTRSLYCIDTLNFNRSKLYFDNLPSINLWANSLNPAGMIFLDNLTHVNLVEAGYSYNSKGLKSPVEPGITNSFYANTRGYKKLGKLIFSGSFGYINEHYNDLYNNNTLMFDHENPYILGDTIGGKQRKEGFLLKGGLACPLSKKITIGIDADYQNYVGAKIKDPRNKNDISSLTIIPGLIFTAGNIQAGISGGPVIFNNNIDIDVIEDLDYNLFQFMGFGYFKSIRNISSYSNTYYGKGYHIQAQFKYDKRIYSNFIMAGLNSYNEEVRYGTSRRLIDGISDWKEINVRDIQIFKRDNDQHRLNMSFNMLYINGTEVMQHSESVIVGQYRYDTLITDSWTKGKQITTNFDGTVEYAFTRFANSIEKFTANAGVYVEYQSINHYPVQNYGSQEVMNVMPFAGYKRNISLNSMTLVPELSIEYRLNLSKDMKYFVTLQSLPEFQEQDYIARHSDFICGNAGVTFLRKTKNKNIPEYFFNIKMNYTHYPEGWSGPAQNIFFNSSLGLIF